MLLQILINASKVIEIDVLAMITFVGAPAPIGYGSATYAAVCGLSHGHKYFSLVVTFFVCHIDHQMELEIG